MIYKIERERESETQILPGSPFGHSSFHMNSSASSPTSPICHTQKKKNEEILKIEFLFKKKRKKKTQYQEIKLTRAMTKFLGL